VEIGPGAGRWTEFLVTKTGSLIGVDISQVCVDECRKRFAKFPNARFEIGNGRDIASVATNSVDGIWSFDVFVHINSEEFSSYAAEFARVLHPGGIVVIHHGSTGGSVRGNRSNVTTAQVYEFMSNNGLEVQEQVQTWRDGGREYPAGLYGDTITIARKPS
jgi:cyclopropane fatty-acyl-phospholipid synthase-like methyltransferase